MLNKIKEKMLHILRKLCGYYELEREFKYRINEIKILKDICLNEKNTIMNNFNDAIVQLDKLSAQHEAKILEYDILKNSKSISDIDYSKLLLHYEGLLKEIGICDTYGVYSLEDEIKIYKEITDNNYKKYLIAELEQILTIMKEKGIHPQDLIKRIINKAKRNLKE